MLLFTSVFRVEVEVRLRPAAMTGRSRVACNKLFDCGTGASSLVADSERDPLSNLETIVSIF
jgi:hypothetical protein